MLTHNLPLYLKKETYQTELKEHSYDYQINDLFDNTALFDQKLSYYNLDKTDYEKIVSSSVSLNNKNIADLQNFKEGIKKFCGSCKTNKAASLENSMQVLDLYIIDQVTQNPVASKISGECLRKLAIDNATELKQTILSTIFTQELFLLTQLDDKKDADKVKAEFIATVSNQADWIDYLFEIYPVALFRLFKGAHYKILFLLEFLTHLVKDEKKLMDHYSINISDITAIQTSKGDTHNNLKSVIKIDSDITSVYYKPRNNNIDNAFYSFIDWCIQKGLELDIEKPNYIDCNTYHWVEHVKYKHCKDLKEVEKFYKNLGTLMSVFQILGTTDMIADNYISVGEKICIIDLETILQNTAPIEMDSEFATNVEADRYQNSLIKTSILPIWANSNRGRLEVLRSPLFKGNDNKNFPGYNGRIYNVTDFFDAFLDAFEVSYRFLLDNKLELLDPNQSPLNAFENSIFRVIFRDTQTYSIYETQMGQPDLNESFIEMDISLDNLWTGHSSKYLSNKVIESEIKQLWHGDIPYFYSKAQSTDIFANGELVVSNFFENDVMQMVKKRILGLSEEDYKYQKEIITGTVNLYLNLNTETEEEHIPYIEWNTDEISNNNHVNFPMEYAKRLCNELLSTAKEKDGLIYWLDYGEFTFDNQRPYYTHIKGDLYGGISGYGILFLAMYQITQEQKYKDVFLKILKTLTHQFIQIEENNIIETNYERFKHAVNISPLGYPCSILYLSYVYFEKFGELPISEAMHNRMLNWIERNLEYTLFDLMVGSAGCMILMCNGYNSLKNERCLDIALKCFNHLKENAVEIKKGQYAWGYYDSIQDRFKMLSGFSHGTAGISYALFELFNITKRQDIFDLAILALNYDRTFFDKDTQKWLDNRNTDFQGDPCSWCHGSAGVGLGRYLSAKSYLNENIENDILSAYKNIKNQGFGLSHCVCHGDSGNLEIMYTLSTYLNKKDDCQKILDIVDSYSKDSLKKKIVTGIEHTLPNRSFFIGETGFAYQLLKIKHFKELSSVISLKL